MNEAVQTTSSAWPMAFTIALIVVLLFVVLWIWANLSNSIHAKKQKQLTKVQKINGAVLQQTNVNSTVHNTVNNTTNSTRNNYYAEVKHDYASDDEYIEAMRAKYATKQLSSTTTTTESTAITPDNSAKRTSYDKVVEDHFDEILQRLGKGQSKSRIFREVFNTKGGDVYLKLDEALKRALGEE